MKNKQNFLNKLKNAIIKSRKNDEKIEELKREKECVNEEINQYIAENKAMFKKKRISDFFTEKAMLICGFSSNILAILLLITNIASNIEFNILFGGAISLSFLSFFMLILLLDIKPKSKKAKFLLKLKSLRNDKRKVVSLIKNVNIENKNIEKIIYNFEKNNNDDNKKLIDLPVSTNILKRLSDYFSESEIRKMMFVKNGESLNYYDIVNFMSKIENQEDIKKKADRLIEMAKSEEVYCAN